MEEVWYSQLPFSHLILVDKSSALGPNILCVISKVKASSYIAQYPGLRTAQSVFTLYFPDRPVHSDTISASLGSIQLNATNNARRLLVHISTTVYSQVLI